MAGDRAVESAGRMRTSSLNHGGGGSAWENLGDLGSGSVVARGSLRWRGEGSRRAGRRLTGTGLTMCQVASTAAVGDEDGDVGGPGLGQRRLATRLRRVMFFFWVAQIKVAV